jgi:hypothetical protein
MDCFASLAMTAGYSFAISPRVSREFWPARSALSNLRRSKIFLPAALDSKQFERDLICPAGNVAGSCHIGRNVSALF